MTRILFGGDTAGTGFGTVTRDLGTELLARGHEVRFLSINEQPTDTLEEPFAGRTAIVGQPSGWLGLEDPVAMTERLEGMFTGTLFEDGWTPEAAIILGDVGSLKVSPIYGFIPDGFPAFHYVPIEGDGLPPLWAQLWSRLRPVAISEFGADQVASVGLPRPPVVYHGVDTDSFWQVSPERPIYLGDRKLHSRDDCKRFFGADPKRVWILRTDRHMPRKMYGSLLRALAPVLARHPEAEFVYHCRTRDQGGDLDDERSKFGPYLGTERVVRSDGQVFEFPRFGGIASRMTPTRFHDVYGGLDRPILNALYNAADIYVSNSAEGFGLTIAEALACGVPVVGLDYSAVPEVIGRAGIVVPVATRIDNIYSHFWAWAREDAFGAAVERLVTDPLLRRTLGVKGPEHVRSHFSWTVAARQFEELISAATRIEVAA